MRHACPVCGTIVDGRADKVYCSDSCKVLSYRLRKKSRNSRKSEPLEVQHDS